MEPKLHADGTGRRMAILDTFTTSGPMSVCYPRLNSTLPPERPALDGVKVNNPSSAIDKQGLDLVNEVECFGFDSAVGFLLVK